MSTANGKTMMYVIDKNYRILYANYAFQTNYPDIECGHICYEALGHIDTVCSHCPLYSEEQAGIFYNKPTEEWIKVQSSEIEWGEIPDCHAIIVRAWRGEEDNPKLQLLDEEICLQKKLLDRERELKKQQEENMRRLVMIQALSRDYGNVYCTDLDADTFEIYRLESFISPHVREVVSNMNCYSYCIYIYTEECVYEEDRTMLKVALSAENIKKQLADRESFVVNYRTCRGDDVLYYQVKCVALVPNEEISKVIIGFRNVDEEVRKEMEKKQMLADALAHAEAASHAKTTFLNNMSHDIRTPMNAIIGFTKLASTHIDDKEKVKDYLEKIAGSSDHLLALINDVLDMSRIESGKMCLEEQPSNLMEFVQDMMTVVQSDIDAKRLHFTIDTTEIKDENIYCDKLRLNQVLWNLISNAIKFTDADGNIMLQIRQLTIDSKEYASYAFHVKDTGCGMSKEFVEHIFEPFTREQTSTVSGVQGTGLGMSVTKSIVDMMGGNVQVKSELGKGTEVIVTITLRLHEEEAQEKSRVEIEDYFTDNRLKGKRILLAEDNELNSEIVVEILRDAGLVVETAENGKIAFEMLKKSEAGYYAMVLMDIQMPVMDGYEASRKIRSMENKELAGIPIIAMTANAFEEDKKMALENGMDGHLAKPIEVEKLFQTISQMLLEKET